MSLPGLLLLDRDGVLFLHVEPYILSPSDVTVAPGAPETVHTATKLGVPVAVVTNQSPVGRGILSWEFIHQVNARIPAWVPEGDRHRVRCYVCPHLPDEGCDCRKPHPGLLLRAAEDAGVDISTAWMVGDHDTDITAARAAGCALAVHLTTGRQPEPSRTADICLDNLRAFNHLLSAEPTGDSASNPRATKLRRHP